MFRELQSCRLCGGSFWNESLNLRETPLANELYSNRNEAIKADRFPLVVVMCKKCKHVQLKHIVNSNRLFSKYVYKSGTSQTFREHFRSLAQEISLISKPGDLIIEIGSNDGTLLRELDHQKLIAVGIEPSEILVNASRSEGDNVLLGFLNEEVVRKVASKYGQAQVVIGNNVFAHIDDLSGAVRCVWDLLKNDGIFVFEVAYLGKMIEKGIFDTIYHEHMSYHSVIALKEFLSNQGFSLVDFKEIPTHGGSIRVFASKDKSLPISRKVENFIEIERKQGLDSPEIFQSMAYVVEKLRISTASELSQLDGTEKIFGYGAPAKVVTFLSEMHLENLPIVGVIDDNPEKQNCYLPGTGLEILSIEDMKKNLRIGDQKLICLIFPWNLSDEVLGKLRLFMPSGSVALSFFPGINRVDF